MADISKTVAIIFEGQDKTSAALASAMYRNEIIARSAW